MKLEVHIEDKFENLHVLTYDLYQTDLTKRWIVCTMKNLQNPRHYVASVFNNRTELDVPEITENIKKLVNTLNKEYDKHIDNFESLDNVKLNYLHEEFEIFGQRMEELRMKGLMTKSLNDNFFLLNEYIHMCEDAIVTKQGTWGGFGILYDIQPLGIFFPIKEEDKLLLEAELTWGKLYLGYNTLGKDWFAVCKDNDVDVILRDMVKPQKRFAAETWLNFNGDQLRHQKIAYFQKWVKSLPEEAQKKVPYHNLNELTLGRFQLGELIIDDNFLRYDPNPLHWKSYRHECKLKWNHEVLTTFRKILEIRLV